MLPNTITVGVDLLNNGTPTNQTWTRTDFFNTRSVYQHSDHTVVARDLLNFYRTPPTRTGNYNGVSKCAVKLSEDVEVPGFDKTTTLTAPLIGEVTFNLPVGSLASAHKVLRQRLIALLDDDVLMEQLFGGQV